MALGEIERLNMTKYEEVDGEEGQNTLQQVKITNQQSRLCSKSGYIFPMEYEEVAGNRESTLYHTAGDNHLYRFNRPLNATGSKLYVYCYHVKITRNAEIRLAETGEIAKNLIRDHDLLLSRWQNHIRNLRRDIGSSGYC